MAVSPTIQNLKHPALEVFRCCCNAKWEAVKTSLPKGVINVVSRVEQTQGSTELARISSLHL